MVFKEWLKKNAHLMIKAFFVFQVQPISPSCEPFVVLIFPSNNGKVNEQILCLLEEIEKLKEKSIKIIGYASDGDTYISQRNDQNIQMHFVVGSFKSITLDKPIVIRDPFHILKRSRYRMIKAMRNQINKT